MTEKLNFTIGPVMMYEETKKLGSLNNPYFRNDEFSKLMLENEKMFLETLYAPADYRALFITGSGTAAMDATVQSLIHQGDKALVINGGSFGQRFSELLDLYNFAYEECRLEFGQTLKEKDLLPYAKKGFTHLFINLHETSSGVLYDLDLVSKFCLENNILLIVDAISAYLADEIDLSKNHVDLLITGSQKALALPPGLSLIAISKRVQDLLLSDHYQPLSMYLDLRSALENMERGQTPFTPAIGIILQLHQRLEAILDKGIAKERNGIKNRAVTFREEMDKLGLKLFAENKSNALTTIQVDESIDASQVVDILSSEYNLWVTPSGGVYRKDFFRVGHIGNITDESELVLINAMKALYERGILK